MITDQRPWLLGCLLLGGPLYTFAWWVCHTRGLALGQPRVLNVIITVSWNLYHSPGHAPILQM